MDNIKSREDVGRRQVLNAAGFGLLGLVEGIALSTGPAGRCAVSQICI